MKTKLVLLFCLIFTVSVNAQDRGLVPVEKVTGKSQTTIEANYHALIIGNNTYSDPAITSLDEPVNDAQKLYNVLTNDYTFSPRNVILLKNATYREMIRTFDGLSNKLTEDDNLLIFYAGHGWWDDDKQLGYWLPTDAEKNFTAFWIRNSTISDYMSSIKSKHTLLIADACFSGSIFKTRSAFNDASPAIKRLYALPSKSAMTSGNLKEVPDKSAFLQYLVKRLQQNDKKYISADQLFASFRIAVMNNSQTEPQFGTIQNAGDEGGEFIFIKRNESQTDNTDNNTQPEWGEEESIAAYGSILIESEIAGTVYLDGERLGSINANTRRTLNNVSTGSHSIKITEGGESFTDYITVYKDQTASVNVKSKKKPKPQDLPDRFTDSRDGKVYNIVEIGSQVWMAENLAYKAGSGCWAYDDDESNVSKYGYLYNFETAKNVCPNGWHLSSKSEFETLLNNYGGSSDSKANYSALIPGGSSGFSALFGGNRINSGHFYSLGSSGFFWSSSSGDDTTAWYLNVYSYYEKANLSTHRDRSVGRSVRCLQD